MGCLSATLPALGWGEDEVNEVDGVRRTNETVSCAPREKKERSKQIPATSLGRRRNGKSTVLGMRDNYPAGLYC